MNPAIRLRIVISSAAVVAALSPFTFSLASGVTTRTAACSDGTCCTEEASICFINGIRTDNAYFKAGGGSCKPGET